MQNASKWNIIIYLRLWVVQGNSVQRFSAKRCRLMQFLPGQLPIYPKKMSLPLNGVDENLRISNLLRRTEAHVFTPILRVGL